MLPMGASQPLDMMDELMRRAKPPCYIQSDFGLTEGCVPKSPLGGGPGPVFVDRLWYGRVELVVLLGPGMRESEWDRLGWWVRGWMDG
jgi:hypothetical protein